jgi:hypothetical protein
MALAHVETYFLMQDGFSIGNYRDLPLQKNCFDKRGLIFRTGNGFRVLCRQKTEINILEIKNALL